MVMEQSLLMLNFGSTRPENLAGSNYLQQFNSISYRKVYSEVLAFNYSKMNSK
jgi:hypothetical protein